MELPRHRELTRLRKGRVLNRDGVTRDDVARARASSGPRSPASKPTPTPTWPCYCKKSCVLCRRIRSGEGRRGRGRFPGPASESPQPGPGK